MQLIASDTPKILIDAIAKVDVSKLTNSQIDNFLKMFDENVGKVSFISRREKGTKIKAKEVSLPGIPDKVLKKISEYDFSKVKLFIPAFKSQIHKWISDNLPLKQGVKL